MDHQMDEWTNEEVHHSNSNFPEEGSLDMSNSLWIKCLQATHMPNADMSPNSVQLQDHFDRLVMLEHWSVDAGCGRTVGLGKARSMGLGSAWRGSRFGTRLGLVGNRHEWSWRQRQWMKHTRQPIVEQSVRVTCRWNWWKLIEALRNSRLLQPVWPRLNSTPPSHAQRVQSIFVRYCNNWKLSVLVQSIFSLIIKLQLLWSTRIHLLLVHYFAIQEWGDKENIVLCHCPGNIPNGLSCGDMGAGMVLAPHKLVHHQHSLGFLSTITDTSCHVLQSVVNQVPTAVAMPTRDS